MINEIEIDSKNPKLDLNKIAKNVTNIKKSKKIQFTIKPYGNYEIALTDAVLNGDSNNLLCEIEGKKYKIDIGNFKRLLNRNSEKGKILYLGEIIEAPPIIEKKGMNPLTIIIPILLLAIGGVVAYILIKKKKSKDRKFEIEEDEKIEKAIDKEVEVELNVKFDIPNIPYSLISNDELKKRTEEVANNSRFMKKGDIISEIEYALAEAERFGDKMTIDKSFARYFLDNIIQALGLTKILGIKAGKSDADYIKYNNFLSTKRL